MAIYEEGDYPPNSSSNKAPKAEKPTYQEMMQGIIICPSDEAFKAITDDQEKSYLGTGSRNLRTGNYAETMIKSLSCNYSQSREEAKPYPLSLHDAAMLSLTLEGKEKRANLMRITKEVYHDRENGFIRVEFWYVSPKEEG